MMIKNVYFWINIVLLLGVSIGIFLLNSLNKSVNVPQELVLKNGDLVLRCGKSMESYAVVLADSNAEFSHVGIICIQNHIPYVIHAVPHKNKFIKKDKITEFLSPENASKYAIYRANYNPAILNNAALEADKFYKKKYTFDNYYDLNTNSKLYCSELILKAFQNVGVNLNIKPKPFNYGIGKHAIIFPSQFTKTPLFNNIINP